MNPNNSSSSNATLKQWTAGLAPHTKITLYSVLLVWSLLGNVLVIAVVYCNQNLRTNMNYLIVNMAVSDLLVPLVALPWMILREIVRSDEWLVEGPLGDALCKLVPFLSDISPFVSSINLAIIAFQRFTAVDYLTRTPLLTPKTRWILISIPWIVATALFSPYFYTYRLTNGRGYTMCSYSWSPVFESRLPEMISFSIAEVVGFIIPLIAIIILYTIMQYKLRKSLNNVVELIESEMIRSRQQRNRRIFSMILTIILLFTVSWCPLEVLNILDVYERISILSMDQEIIENTFFSLVYLWYLQAAINPCIYFLFLRDFRQGLRKLCCKKTASGKEQTFTLCVYYASNMTTGEDSNKNPTCTSPHINTTSV